MLKSLNAPYNAVNRLLAVSFIVLASSSARADYVVINDDLMPTRPAQVTAPPQRFVVPFNKGHTQLTSGSKTLLDGLVIQMLQPGASIKVIGRPDAMYAPKGPSALARANSVRNYLMRKGVSAEKIEVEADNSPNPQANGSLYPSDLLLTTQTTQPQQAQPQQSPSFSTYQQNPPSAPQAQAGYSNIPQLSQMAPQAPQAPASNQERDQQLLQYINQAVRSGQLDPAVAVTLMRQMLTGDSSRASVQSRPDLQALAPPPKPQAPLFVATPALARKETWVLDKKLTLRENLDAWSKLAGWNPSVWEASNYYEVTATSTLEGGFPDILRQIAESTGLNICAKTREKFVRVTESNVSCR